MSRLAILREEGPGRPVTRRVSNPPNPHHHSMVEWIDAPPSPNLQVFKERAKSIITKNKSPDIPFDYSVNPYRGCFHACAYCYARPSHQYLDFGAGTDFETKIIAKVNAPELLREEFMKRSWKGEPLTFSGNTDCYQPLELSYELTKRCLEICLEFQNPVRIITKGAIIRRDIELIKKINDCSSAHVAMSIAFENDDLSKLVEPGAPRPSVRFRALKELSDAGIPTGIAVAPVIPGLTDSEVPKILERGATCGARNAFMTIVRLPNEVREIFAERITKAFPARAAKILSQVQEAKGGVMNRSEFGRRLAGEGPRWDAVQWMFDHTTERLGLNTGEGITFPELTTFKRPQKQLAFSF